MTDRVAEAFFRAFDDSFEAIDLLLERKLLQPALVVTYTTIDAAASLDRAANHRDVERSDFIRWVDRYLLPDSGLECTAMDLYAARCGLVHAFASSSALTRQGKARRIGYAWGNADIKDLWLAAQHQGKDDIVPVHLKTLTSALRGGFTKYLDDVVTDEQRMVLALSRAQELFGHVPSELMKEYLEAVRIQRDA